VVTASEGRESDAYRDSSNRLLGSWRAYDAEAAPPHSDPQLRTSKTVDSSVGLGATEGLGASCPYEGHVPHTGRPRTQEGA